MLSCRRLAGYTVTVVRPFSLPLIALLLLGVGCNRPRFDTPVDAYTSFTRAVQKSEFDVAFGALSSRTQAALKTKATQISRASGGAVKDDPAALFFAEEQTPAQVTEIKLVEQDGDTALLSVKAGQDLAQVRMVKEAGGWRIDLFPQAAAERPDGAR